MTDRTPQEILASARLPERSHRVCLRGDLQARWEQLNRRLAEAPRATSLEGDGRPEIAAQMVELEREMESSTLELTLRALRRDEYQSLKASHPPRKPADVKRKNRAKADGDEEALAELEQIDQHAAVDKQVGVNVATFYAELIRACHAAPELEDEDWDRLFEVVTNQQFEELATVALLLNEGEIQVPFSPTASRLTRTSGASSK